MRIYQKIKSWLAVKNNFLAFTGIITGLAAGFLYYYFIGCRTGSCPITSSPWLSMFWGALLGYLISDMFRKKKKEAPEEGTNNP